MATLANLNVRVGATTRDFDRALAGVERRTAGLRGRLGKLGSALGTAIKVGALVGGAALVGLGVASVGMASSFETAFAEVTTLFDAPKAVIDSLRSGVLQLAGDMGIDAVEATQALYQAISAGVAPTKALQFLETNARLAVGGVTDLKTAVDLTTTVLNAFGLGIGKTADVSDILFTGVRLGKTTVQELGRSLFQVAPQAAAANVGIDQVTAALAALTASGFPTAQATTSLRQAIVELSKDGSKVAAIFENAAGQSFPEFMAAGGDLTGAMELLQKAAKDNNVAVSDLFSSVEAGGAIAVLAGKGFGSLETNLEAMGKRAGASEAAFEKMNQTFNRQKDILKSKLKVAMIELGSRILPPLTKAVSKLTPFVVKATDALFDAGGVVGNLIQLIGATFTRDIDGMGKAWAALPADIRPFAAKLIELAKFIRDEVVPVIVDDVVPAVVELGRNLLDIATAVWPTVQRVLGNLRTGFEVVFPAVKSLFTFIVSNKPLLIAAIVAIGIAIVTSLGPLGTAFAAIGALIFLIGFFKNHWDEIKRAVSKTVGQIRDRITGVFTRIKDFLADNWQEILTIAAFFLAGPVVGLVALFSTNAFGIRDKVVGAFTQMKDWALEKLTAFKDGVIEKLNLLKTFFTEDVKGFFTEDVPGWFSTMGLAIQTRAVGAMNKLITAFERGINFVIDGLNGWLGGLNEILGVANKISGLFGGPSVPSVPTIPTVSLPRLEQGGVVPGRLGEPVLAMVHAGEEVLTPEQQRERGRMTAQFFAPVHIHTNDGPGFFGALEQLVP